MCRLALVLRGIEGYTVNDSALLLGISKATLEAAYCAGLESLEIITSEAPVEETLKRRCRPVSEHGEEWNNIYTDRGSSCNCAL